MDQEQRKAKKRVIGLFLLYLFIALACFGVCAYFIITYRGTESVSEGIVNASKIFALIGVFFLVVDLGYILPALIKKKNVNPNKGISDSNAGKGTTDILNEANMRQTLGKYIPDGETLLAGIHAVSKETVIKLFFGNCACTEKGLVPHENGGVIVHKEKYAVYDVYLGITQYSLVITECERNRYLYQFDEIPGLSGANIQEVTSEILFTDIGKCFPLSDIKSCEIKNGWLGSVKCFITMKNGSHFKLMLPKLGGLGGEMPHHTEYRQAIIARLGGRIE